MKANESICRVLGKTLLKTAPKINCVKSAKKRFVEAKKPKNKRTN